MATCRRSTSTCLMVLLGACLLAGAFCPRGILRATELSKVDATELTDAVWIVSDASTVDHDLPPVPPLRLRDEQEAELLSFSVAMAATEPQSVAPPPPAPTAFFVENDDHRLGTTQAPPRPSGDRAPPRSI